MAQEPDQLRAQIEQQRAEISGTVDEIGNRVNPAHALARRQDRVKRRLTDWKDSVFGNDEPDYPTRHDWYAGPTTSHDAGGGIGQTVSSMASSASHSVQHAPSAVRRQARGNPMAAGAVALAAGWLVGSVLPETRREQRAVRRIEPQLSDAADAVRQEGRALAEDLEEPARHAADEVKRTGQEAAAEVKERGTHAAEDVREQTGA